MYDLQVLKHCEFLIHKDDQICPFFQIDSYMGKFGIFLSELKNLTIKVGILESSLDKYIKLDFELLTIELREFEALVTQLKKSLNVTSPMFDSLYVEVKKKRQYQSQVKQTTKISPYG